jgi:RNA polymerase sigma-70 factor (ECF subfamily)
MDPLPVDLHLSRITTLWTLVGQAHEAGSPEGRGAQEALLQRYSSAIRRYLLGALRNQDAADDVFQDFAYRFLHGDLRGADRQRGRFRDFVKGVLFHLVADHYKKQQRQPRPLPPDHPEPAAHEEPWADQDEAFRRSWRDSLLARSWADLEALQKKTGQPFYTVLRYRADHPELHSPELAEQLSGVLGRPLTAAGVRQLLHRGREKFADFLLEEVAQALESPSRQQLEEELIELELLEHCRPALERRGEPD